MRFCGIVWPGIGPRSGEKSTAAIGTNQKQLKLTFMIDRSVLSSGNETVIDTSGSLSEGGGGFGFNP